MTETPTVQSPGKRWQEELRRSKDYLEPWHKSVRTILKRLKDQRPEGEGRGRRLNLFTAEYLTKRAVLYGKTPTITVSRTWKDSDDDVARVAGEMLQRVLNADTASGKDGYTRALGRALEDRLAGAMGQARTRYEVKTEPIQGAGNDELGDGDGGPGVPSAGGDLSPGTELLPVLGETAEEEVPQRKVYECAKVDYTYWEDFLYSPARRWELVRWVAFGSDMGRKALKKRFGAKADGIPLDSTDGDDQKKREQEPPWGRARVWEVWDREEKKVYWVTDTGTLLDEQEDILGLDEFFPCPEPFFGFITNDELIPRPDFIIAQDLYNDLDELSTRIHLLRTSLRVVGIYDPTVGDLATLMEDTRENRMIPSSSWALLKEKGGIRGSVEYFPIQEVASAIVSLEGEFEALKQRLYEVTGMSDILRGQGASQAVTATEQRIKANFGSARLQSIQDDFARFASNLQQLRAEVICKHYDAEEIIRQSNILNTPDAHLAQQAVEFLKNQREHFRIEVQPEALAMADFSALKEERMEVIGSIAQFISASTPLMQSMPQAAPALIEMLKWVVSSLRGASSIEGVLDKALNAAQQAASNPQQEQQAPDPKLIAAEVKGRMDIQKVEAEKNARMEEIQAEVAADEQREANQMRYNVQEHAAKQTISNALRPPNPTKPGGMP